MNNSPWSVKYRPKKISDVFGNTDVVNRVKDFILNFKKGQKPLLLNGPPGCGKTSSVFAVGQEFSYEIFELNASDDRNKNNIVERVGSSMQQASLFGNKKIILLEEIDGLSGSRDRGGLSEILKLLPKSQFPVIMTANNPWDKKFSKIRNKSELITISPPGYEEIAQALRNILDHEKLEYDDDVIKSLAMRNSGDFRGAINDLQILSYKKTKITKLDLDVLGDRNRTESIQNALMRIFKTFDNSVSLASFSEVNENIDEQFLWLEENIFREYKNKNDLSNAYNILSRADVFRGRIRKQQHWRFLSYISELLTSGISQAKQEKYSGVINYKQNSRILKIWIANQSNLRKKSISKKIAEKIHSSTSKINNEFNYYKMLFKNLSSEDIEQLSNFFDLDNQDLSVLKK